VRKEKMHEPLEPEWPIEDLEKFYYTIGQTLVQALATANNMGIHPTTLLKNYWRLSLATGRLPAMKRKALEFVVDFVSLKSGAMARKWLRVYKDRTEPHDSAQR
jgi:hypothetical protein